MKVYIWKKCSNYEHSNYKKYLWYLTELSLDTNFVDGHHIKKIDDVPGNQYNIYRARAGKARIIFTIINGKYAEHEDCCLVLEIIEDHDYDRSYVLRYRDNLHEAINFLSSNLKQILDDKNIEEINFASVASSSDRYPASNHGLQDIKKIAYCYYLNDELIMLDEAQENILANIVPPVIINGPPGSGKTLIGLQLLLQKFKSYCEKEEVENINLLYITKSKNLVDKVKEEFARQTAIFMPDFSDSKVDIITYKELLDKYLELPFTLVEESFDFYKQWLKSIEFNACLDSKDITNQKKLIDIFFNKDLFKNGNAIAEKIYKEFRIISGYPTVELYLANHQRKNNLGGIEKHIEVSNQEKQKFLFGCYENFIKYAEVKNKALCEFYKIDPNKLLQSKYKFVIVDESQDFSYLQLRMISKLAFNENIVWFIDERQNITDDLIKTTFIGNLFFPFKITNVLGLTNIYRCPTAVMKVAKVFELLRMQVTPIDKSKAAIMEDFSKKGKVFWFDPEDLARQKDDVVLRETLTRLKEDANVCIVTREEYKRQAKEELGVLQIFTPEEVKGLQYNTVVLYKILDDEVVKQANGLLQKNQSEAKKIYATDIKFSSAFNKLFVAATRTLQQLIIFQSKEVHELQYIIQELQKAIPENYSYMDVSSNSSDPSAWSEQVKYLEKQGFNEMADQVRREKLADITKENELDSIASITSNLSQPSITPCYDNKTRTSKKKYKKLKATEDSVELDKVPFSSQDYFDVKKAVLDFNMQEILNAPMENPEQEGLLLSLTVAILTQDLQTVNKLLDSSKGIENTRLDQAGWTPLHLAVYNNSVDIVEALLKKSSDVNATCYQGFTSLHYAVGSTKTLQILKLLLNAPNIDLNVQKDSEKNTPLHCAIKAENLPAIEQLLKHRQIDLNARNNKDMTPEQFALAIGNIKIFTLLQKADLCAKKNAQAKAHYRM